MQGLTDWPGVVKLQKPMPEPASRPDAMGEQRRLICAEHAVRLYPATGPPATEQRLPGRPSVPCTF